jgi:hypothetical protein
MLERLKQIASQKTHAGLAVTLAVCSSSSHFSLTNALFSTIFSCLRSLRVRPNRFRSGSGPLYLVSRFPLSGAPRRGLHSLHRARAESAPRTSGSPVPVFRSCFFISLLHYFISFTLE